MKTYIAGSFQFNQKQWLIQKVDYKLSNTQLLKFFSPKNQIDLIEKIEEFLNGELHSLYINTTTIGISEDIGRMIIELISTYIINSKQKDNNAFVMFIDEVHRYSNSFGNDQYQIGLTSIAREGRKKGIFLTTQNLNDVPKELLG